MRLSSLLLAVVLATPLATTSANAEELSAQEIVKKALAKGNVGFMQGTATLEMVLKKKSGNVESRTLEVKVMRNEDKLLRSMVKFTKPAKIAGMSFLVREKKDGLPDQAVYVPAAKVVRRIAAGNANAKFFGSDFNYVDLMPLPTDDMNQVKINKLASGKIAKYPTYTLEVLPNVEGSPYGRLVLHVHQEKLVPLKVEYFDAKKAPLKTLVVKRLKEIEGELVPIEIEMKAKSGTSTTLKVKKINPKAKLSDADFTEEAMAR